MRHLQTQYLNGLWDFGFCEGDPIFPIAFRDHQPVPGCFDVSPEWSGRRGVGAYKMNVSLATDCHYRLRTAVAHNATVYVDGGLLGCHHGAHTYFELDLPKLPIGKHELLILADNRFDGLNRPLHMDFFDWYNHGGIIRPVELIPYRDALIESVLPVMDDPQTGRVVLHIRFHAAQDAPSRLSLRVQIDQTLVAETTVDAAIGTAIVPVTVAAPKAWSPNSPHLHDLHIQLADDAVTMNLGLRTIRTDGPRILLNGQSIAIKGINRHHLHMQFGFALPESLMWHDAVLIKRLGANFIRGSHYPQDPRFLDICDRLGLLVWSEANGWNYDPTQVTDPRMIAAQLQCVQEMIRQSADHPSVACWGFFNECASDQIHCRPVYEKIISAIRQHDPTRPVTFASSRLPFPEGGGSDDQMLDLVDWIGFNTYPGWYGGDLSDAESRLTFVADYVRRRQLIDRPIIISEIGSAAIPGFNHHWPVKWSENYQASLHEVLLNAIRNEPAFSGVCVWQFCDMLTEVARQMNRPRGYNNKGILDEYRRPKQAYFTIQKCFRNWT